ncbi:MerR family transcriptional regulator [Staphylococcus nepalensis]|uniref:MerR family transcriptional regulator n=1 Tax=Staphylococcus nepalensis TaxID=214473 RepID=UPI00230076CA|nr:MerR family transcriptional regulator [Staphylococcus nepalensis]
MSEYTTGELANLFCLSKRTIQFYDKKGILKPAYIKHNNYRVYTDKEVQKLKLFKYLKTWVFL